MIAFLTARILFSLRKNSYLLFFITLSFAGMAIGTASLLLIMAFMTGAQDMIRQRYLAGSPHLLVQPASGPHMEDIPGARERLAGLPHVRSVIRTLSFPALSADWCGEISATDQTRTVRIPFGRPGERVRILLPILTLTPAGLAPSGMTLIKESNGGAADRIEAPLALLQGTLGLSGRISSYAILLSDLKYTASVRQEVGKIFRGNARILTFADLNAPLFLALSLEKWLMFAGVGLVLLVSFLQLHQSFSLLVLHHEMTWATLAVLGASARSVTAIFAAVALAVALSGGLFGLLLALGLGFLPHGAHLRDPGRLFAGRGLPVRAQGLKPLHPAGAVCSRVIR